MKTPSLISTLLIFCVLYSTLATASTEELRFENKGKLEIYSVDDDKRTLSIKTSNTENKFENILGVDGESFRGLTRFNNGPALFYENTASSTSFSIYYTLKTKEQSTVIDCLYSNIRHARNGVSIRKAVCSLDKPLTSNYHDIVYEYSNSWIDDFNVFEISPLTDEPPRSVDLPIGKLGEAQVILQYESIDDLLSETPNTLLIKDKKNYSMGRGLAYLVYDANSRDPIAIDIVTDPETNTIKRASTLEEAL